jgi:hypothetical protein
MKAHVVETPPAPFLHSLSQREVDLAAVSTGNVCDNLGIDPPVFAAAAFPGHEAKLYQPATQTSAVIAELQ